MSEVDVIIKGSAGSGKTVVMNLLSEILCAKCIPHTLTDDGNRLLDAVCGNALSLYSEDFSFHKDRIVDISTSEDNGHILMSAENHAGHKLEELLPKLIEEINWKTSKICDDDKIQAKTVVQNNEQICGLLQQAAAIQRQSYILLDAMRENEGPAGQPRIGENS